MAATHRRTIRAMAKMVSSGLESKGPLALARNGFVLFQMPMCWRWEAPRCFLMENRTGAGYWLCRLQTHRFQIGQQRSSPTRTPS